MRFRRECRDEDGWARARAGQSEGPTAGTATCVSKARNRMAVPVFRRGLIGGGKGGGNGSVGSNLAMEMGGVGPGWDRSTAGVRALNFNLAREP
jgi:hypothetical protein